MDDFTCSQSRRYLTLSVFWVSLLGMPKTLVIWVRGYPKHGDTQTTVTSEKSQSASQPLGPESRNARRPHAATSNRHTFLSQK